ncbi:hypothetical protein Poly30_54130 [Planctomycetes bacterium Poly30]|uniref:Uncharacterized protein n=1 Tax=Saltatorellus ferox TaxID=2528018 RepID=A0A518F0I9_9BACT|nr:hypothetical protein Poly30_54130 [Planctomycetes bacterium Poly30]
MWTSSFALIGMPGWLELAVVALALLVIVGPRLANFLARRSVERERFRR